MLLQCFLIVIYIIWILKKEKKYKLSCPKANLQCVFCLYKHFPCYTHLPVYITYYTCSGRRVVTISSFFFQRKKIFWHNSTSPEWDYIKWKACFWQNFLSFFILNLVSVCIYISLLLILILFVMSCMMRPKQYILLCKVLCINVFKKQGYDTFLISGSTMCVYTNLRFERDVFFLLL